MLGSTDQPWQISASASKGFRGPAGHQLLTNASFSTLYGTSTGDVRTMGAGARYFVPQTGDFLLYLAASADTPAQPRVSNSLRSANLS